MTSENSNDTQNPDDNTESQEGSDNTYEERLKNSKFPGLLGVFEERLKNRNSESEDEDFATINLTSKDIIGPGSSATEVEKVSAEDIDGLLKTKPTRYEADFIESSSKESTRVEETVVSQTRYEDAHPTTDNRANQDDVKIGYTPVNPTGINNSPHPPMETTPSTELSPVPYSQREISDDEVIKHVMEHRKKKASPVDPDATDTDA